MRKSVERGKRETSDRDGYEGPDLRTRPQGRT